MDFFKVLLRESIYFNSYSLICSAEAQFNVSDGYIVSMGECRNINIEAWVLKKDFLTLRNFESTTTMGTIEL